MNERIQQLAEHCDFYIGNEHHDKSREDQQRLFMEKFAELIVRECAELMYGRDDNGNCKDGDVIKQHFGVE